MDKNDIKAIAQKAKNGADDSIKKVGAAAKKAAAGVNDGLGSAKESMKKTAIAKNALKVLQDGIKELEKENKAKAEGGVQEETQAIIDQLKDLYQKIKKDPENCSNVIETLVTEYRASKAAMFEDDLAGEELLKMQIMSKRYDDALRACLLAERSLDEELEALAKEKAEKEAPTIVELKGSNIRILVPDGYKKAKYKNPAKELKKNISKEEVVLRKYTSRSENILLFKKLPLEKAIPFDGTEKLIDALHNHLDENQGIIEVKAGTAKRGYKYIYSIVKTIRDDFKGALYHLKMHIGTEESIVEIDATFGEEGVTGERDSFGHALAMKAGLVSFDSDSLVGWNEDPYDPEFTKGIPMNLSERAGLDGLFPDHPLSQAREFVTAVTEDKFVIVKQDSDFSDDQANDLGESKSDLEKEYEGNNNQFILDLFEKEPVFHRHTVDIEVN